jgi:hypothetical protein
MGSTAVFVSAAYQWITLRALLTLASDRLAYQNTQFLKGFID